MWRMDRKLRIELSIRWPFLRHTLLQDLRHTWLQLRHHPGFALTAILSLTLGIGATVSVFSVIYGVLMHP